MEYWTQIATSPSLVLGPVLLAAIVSGLVSLWVGRSNRVAASADIDRKIKAERQLTDIKINYERDKALTDRAWTDYGLHRDIYLDLAVQIGCLCQVGRPTSAEGVAENQDARKVFLKRRAECA